MPRRGENIYKRKDGRWEGRYVKGRDDFGKIKYGYVYADSYKGVKEKLKKKPTFCASKVQTNVGTYGDLVYAWLQFKRISVKESTYSKYKYLIDSYIFPYFGDFSIERLEGKCIEKYANELLLAGGKNKKNRVIHKNCNKYYFCYKSIYALCC